MYFVLLCTYVVKLRSIELTCMIKQISKGTPPLHYTSQLIRQITLILALSLVYINRNGGIHEIIRVA